MSHFIATNAEVVQYQIRPAPGEIEERNQWGFPVPPLKSAKLVILVELESSGNVENMDRNKLLDDILTKLQEVKV